MKGKVVPSLLARALHSACRHQRNLSRHLAPRPDPTARGLVSQSQPLLEPPEPVIDTDYLCNSANLPAIQENIRQRKGVGNIHLVQQLWTQLQSHATHIESSVVCDLQSQFTRAALSIPNRSHPSAESLLEEPRVARTIGEKQQFPWTPKELHQLAGTLLRTTNLTNLTGHRSYFLHGSLAEMEHALISYTTDRLASRGFTLVSVPDLVHPLVLEGCGMTVNQDRTQVYTLQPERHGHFCLSGTAEMALAAMLANRVFREDQLPLRLTAISRCYRAEISTDTEEKGIYRVHQFTKVEMFGVTAASGEGMQAIESEMLLEELLSVQENLFAELGLHLRVLEMPLPELGAAAFHKYDVEAWMPGRGTFGEVSSCSNCTDFQSRRLGIRYLPSQGGPPRFTHTVNGTACALPRMLISLYETCQQRDGSIAIPPPLRPYLNGRDILTKPESKAELPGKWIKYKAHMQGR